MLSDELREITRAAAVNRKLDPAALMAVVDVESAGIAYAQVNGKREPLIRFEGHYFHRRLSGKKLETAIKEGLASQKAGAVANPKTQAARWVLLERAIRIDRAAALESTSWGLGQVMGAHWAWLGYANADALVEEARSSLAGQLALMLRYIEKAALLKALQERNWAAFARGYNGPNYAKGGYHNKLAKAYQLYAKTESAPIVKAKSNSVVLQQGDSGAEVKALQKQLLELGYTLSVDGRFGAETALAVKAFQKQAGLSADGVVGKETRAALAQKGTHPASASLLQLLLGLFRRLFA